MCSREAYEHTPSWQRPPGQSESIEHSSCVSGAAAVLPCPAATHATDAAMGNIRAQAINRKFMAISASSQPASARKVTAVFGVRETTSNAHPFVALHAR